MDWNWGRVEGNSKGINVRWGLGRVLLHLLLATAAAVVVSGGCGRWVGWVWVLGLGCGFPCPVLLISFASSCWAQQQTKERTGPMKDEPWVRFPPFGRKTRGRG